MIIQAGQTPEIWTFTISNVLTLVLGTVLTTVAYRAYRREGLRAFLIATAGFAFITVGTITEMVFEFVVNDVLSGGATAFGRELFVIRTAEGVLIAIGLLLLIYSLQRV